ncbi:MAG: Maf family protein [bacterium]
MNNIILASGSPRRAELLTQVGINFTVVVSDYHEKMPVAGDDILIWAKDTAGNKARMVFAKTGGIVLGADTVVILPDDNGEYYMNSRKVSLLGKPENEAEAVNMLRRLSGKEHDVVTAYSIITENKTVVKAITTKVFFYELSDEDILNYVNTGEPMDKAGAYGIQAKGAVFVKSITGDYYNVVGLPISSVVADLKKLRI